jgi:ParB-like chromosome segregation protein Spo0J
MHAPPAFEFTLLDLPPKTLVPRKHLSAALKHSAKHRQIKASLKAIGLIEPIVVFPRENNEYVILDGHVRAAILAELGVPTVTCLIATEEEAYTYNRRVNPINTVQEHHMILQAIKYGVSEETIAIALDVNVRDIRQRCDLLTGIAPEAAELLKTRPATAAVFKILKKMSAYRQIEAAELMIAARNFSVSFASAILAATKAEDLVQPAKKQVNGIPREEIASMQQEMTALQHELARIKDTFANDTLTLSISVKYLATLLGNKMVAQYLGKHHADLLRELQDIAQQPSE